MLWPAGSVVHGPGEQVESALVAWTMDYIDGGLTNDSYTSLCESFS